MQKGETHVSRGLYFSSAELERAADEEEIKVAYRRLAKYYHPDGELPYSSLL